MSGGVTESPVAHAAEGIVSVGLGVGLLEEAPKGSRPHPARRRVAEVARTPAFHTRITGSSYVARAGAPTRHD
jgi:hypothetical protein